MESYELSLPVSKGFQAKKYFTE